MNIQVLDMLAHTVPFLVLTGLCYAYVEHISRCSEDFKYHSQLDRAALERAWASNDNLGNAYAELREALITYHHTNPDILVQQFRLDKLEREEKNRKKDKSE